MLLSLCQKSQTKFADSSCDLLFILSNLNLPNLELATQRLNMQSPSPVEPSYNTTSLSSTGGYLKQELQFENYIACPGALVNYGVSMFSHYPWHLHDLGILDYEFSYIDPRGRLFRVCSNRCARKSPGRGAACDARNQIILGRQFQELIKRASVDPSTAPKTKVQFWSYKQLLHY